MRLLIAALFTLGTMISISVATQGSALAAACDPTGGVFPNGNCSNYVVSHKCEQISPSSNADQADICTDIYASWTQASATGEGSVDIWGEGEYYCQGSSEQCKGINGQNSVSVTATTFTGSSEIHPTDSESSADYTCSTTACPLGGRAMVATTHVTNIIPSAFDIDLGSYTLCYSATATIPTGDAVLVSDTSTAYHPAATFSTSASFCFTAG
jgi:hypothetical protein